MKQEENKALADSMNVSVADVMGMAQSVANSIEQDGAVDALSKASNEDSTKMIQAYVVHAVKKVDRFTTTYLTNPEARETFQKRVYNDLMAKG